MPTSAAAPLVQIGAVLLGLALLGRLAARLGVPILAAPLLAGLALGGIGPLARHLGPPPEVVEMGTPVAVVLLLFTLGLDHGPRDRRAAVAGGSGLGLVDGALNAVPGALAGWLIGPGVRGAVLLAGVTWASSWGAATGLLARRGWMGNRETPAVLSVLVLEHLGLAVYLPLAAALLSPGGPARVAASVLAGLAAVIGAAWLVSGTGPVHLGGHPRAPGYLGGHPRAPGYLGGHPRAPGNLGGHPRAPGSALRWLVLPAGADGHPGAAILAFAGVALTLAGLAQGLRVPAAAAAFLTGLVLAGPETGRARSAVDALRQLSAAATFLLVGSFVGASGTLPGVAAGAALGLVAVTTKFLTGWWGAARLGTAPRGRCRAGVALVARGEISVALAGLALSAGQERLAAATAVCVLVTQAATAVGLRVPPACRPRRSAGLARPARPIRPA